MDRGHRHGGAGMTGRSAVPVRASLVGMLEHLRKSYAAQHPDEAKSA